ncbi:MAG: hypothetical protein KF746_18850 [Chitinophagaceae bacterium]|nr:hypothetical protein [Chitinophagaceae bacterium]
MNQSLKDWIDLFAKVVAATGVFIAALNYRQQTRTKRAEWLKALFEKFYEKEEFKEVRRWIESGEINNKINLDATVSEEEEKVADYLNFFEFIATLEVDKQLKLADVKNLFEYYLNKIKHSEKCMTWVHNYDYGFEKLRNLLDKI